MQIPILSGIYTDNGPDIRNAYPVNMVPVPKSSGISEGYLRPGDGIVQNGTGPGIDRGGINWRGTMYRVMGTKLVSIDPTGAVLELGEVGAGGQVTMDYDFDRLAIASGGNFFYWNGTLTQITSEFLGPVIDFCWIQGYFMTTDGTSLVVTSLQDPTQINQYSYASAEASPDPIQGVLRFRNEVYAIGRNTIELFANKGTNEFFPFYPVGGAQIQKGAVGTHAACIFNEFVAFVGSGVNESPAVYIAMNGSLKRISTQDIDMLLQTYTEAQLATIVCETRNDKAHQFLYIHMIDRTLVYDLDASQRTNQQVWFTLTSTLSGFSKYRGRNLVWAYDRWNVGDPTSTAFGYMDYNISSHYGAPVRWEFSTSIVYNNSNGAIFNRLELVSLAGCAMPGTDPNISTAYSVDGQTWGQEHAISVGQRGARAKRLVWLRNGHMRRWRIQRFRGTSDAQISPVRLEAQLEPLAY
jgi:hypothetical protein